MLKEELKILGEVYKKQWKLFDSMGSILDPRSYRATTRAKIAEYNIQHTWLTELFYKWGDQDDELSRLIQECNDVEQLAVNLINVEEKDHGKAILVFTIITIVFLPLSFVSSLFGMNTADIRDMDHGQSLFWESALPFTAAIVLITLLVAYKGNKIEEWSSTLRGLAKQAKFWSKKPKQLPFTEKEL